MQRDHAPGASRVRFTPNIDNPIRSPSGHFVAPGPLTADQTEHLHAATEAAVARAIQKRSTTARAILNGLHTIARPGRTAG
jgi:hypothetical protein